jgi:hypothetical protein
VEERDEEEVFRLRARFHASGSPASTRGIAVYWWVAIDSQGDTIELHEVDAHWYTEEGAEIEIEALIPIASVDVSTFCATVYPRTTAAGC